LLATLRCFVQSNASPTRTARELHLHTNTVLQRLERITALLGEGWRESEALFRISIAVRMHALSAPVTLSNEPIARHRRTVTYRIAKSGRVAHGALRRSARTVFRGHCGTLYCTDVGR